MKAVGLLRYLPVDDPECLLDVELPVPEPGPMDLRVAVHAVSVNPVDTKIRKPKPAVEASPRVLGWDAAGVVDAVGAEVRGFAVGDAVYYAGSVTRPGSNAEFQLVDARIVARKPRSLSFAEAAALPLTALTAWEALFDRLRIDPGGADAGRSLLIVGGAGGVGSIAIQIAKRIAGLRVIATASRPQTVDACRAHGADVVIDHRHDLVDQLRDAGFESVDFALCCNDTDQHFPALATAIRPQGTVCSIVENARPLPVEQLKSKSAAFVWEFMFTRAMFGTPDLAEQGAILARVAEHIDAGTLRSTLTSTLSPINAENLRRAHAQLESGTTIGKLVLEGF